MALEYNCNVETEIVFSLNTRLMLIGLQNLSESEEFNPIILKRAKILRNFGPSECNRVNVYEYTFKESNSAIFSSLGALGPVVQSILSLTNSLRGQLVKCFMTLKPNTLIFFVEKMREAFALQKLLTFFQPKILVNLKYECLKF